MSASDDHCEKLVADCRLRALGRWITDHGDELLDAQERVDRTTPHA
jgi:hypothetical protein